MRKAVTYSVMESGGERYINLAGFSNIMEEIADHFEHSTDVFTGAQVSRAINEVKSQTVENAATARLRIGLF